MAPFAKGEGGLPQGAQALLKRVLVAEDDDVLRERLVASLTELGAAESSGCRDVAGCLEALREFQPTLLILDYGLRDGTGEQLLAQAASLELWPCTLVVSGEADAANAFAMAQLGARAYLDKPISPSDLRAALCTLAKPATSLMEAAVRTTVGGISVHEVQERIRDTMLAEALARAGGNRRAAARLLHVSRQLVQHMMRARSERLGSP